MRRGLVASVVLAAVLPSMLPAADAAGPYVNQEPPGRQAEIFAPGLVSTERNEHLGPTFSPEGDLMVWSFYTQDRRLQAVRLVGGRWVGPEHLPFNKPYNEDGPYFSPDGRRLYFFSQRPRHGGDERKDWDLWYVERRGDVWSDPHNLGAPVNTERDEVFHAVSNSALFFCTLGPPREMYRAERLADGRYGEPVRLPAQINTDLFYSHPYVAPDESYLILSSTREGGQGSADLWITRRLKDGAWSEPFNLGPAVNTDQAERSPCVTPDGKYLFFIRHKVTPEGGYCCGEMYWVSAEGLLDGLKVTGVDPGPAGPQ